MPTHAVREFLAVAEKHMRSIVQEKDHSYTMECDVVGRVHLPLTTKLTDKGVSDIVNAMTMLTGVHHVSCPLEVESLIRFVLVHIPFRIQDAPRRFVVADAVGKARAKQLAKFSPHKIYDDRLNIDPVLAQVARNMLNKYDKLPIPSGTTRDAYWQMGAHAVRVGAVEVFQRYWGALNQRYNFKSAFMYVQYSRELTNVDPLNFTRATYLAKVKEIPAEYRNEIESPQAQLEALVESRQFRTAHSGDLMADIVTQCHDVYHPGLAMVAKVKAVQQVFPMPPKGAKMTVIGVSEGYDRAQWKEWNTTFYDKNPKLMSGVTVLPCDVQIPEMIRAAMHEADGVFFDTAVQGTGSASFSVNKVVQECSYAKNVHLFVSQAAAIHERQPKWFAMKIFLPPMPASSPPDWLTKLWNSYEVRVVKPGKLHNDELFLVGRHSSIGVLRNSALWERGILRSVVLINFGRIATIVSLASGSYLPVFSAENMRAQAAIAGTDLPFVRASGVVVPYDQTIPGYSSAVDLETFEAQLDSLATFNASMPLAAAATLNPDLRRQILEVERVAFPKVHEQPDYDVLVRYILDPRAMPMDEQRQALVLIESAELSAKNMVTKATLCVSDFKKTKLYVGLVRCLMGDMTATESDWQAVRYYESQFTPLDVAILSAARNDAKSEMNKGAPVPVPKTPTPSLLSGVVFGTPTK
jgi:hypothetical protein